MMPLYLTTRDVLHSPSLWPPDVRVLAAMWELPARKPVYGLATWERNR